MRNREGGFLRDPLRMRTTLVPQPGRHRRADAPEAQVVGRGLEHFREKGLLTPGKEVPSWDQCYHKCKRRAKAHVLANRIPAIDEYVRELNIDEKRPSERQFLMRDGRLLRNIVS